MSTDREYFEREYFQLHPGKVRYLDYLVRLVDRFSTGNGRVLDVGAGFGFLIAALEAAGYEGHGLEISSHACEEARKQTSAPIVNQSAEERFPYPDDFFSAILMTDVIEHLEDPVMTLGECRRCLGPGGRVLVITLSAHSLARPLLGKQWSWFKDPTHLHMFDPAGLRESLETANLSVVHSETFFNFCAVGESTPFLKPLQRIARVVRVPWVGDSVLCVAEKR